MAPVGKYAAAVVGVQPVVSLVLSVGGTGSPAVCSVVLGVFVRDGEYCGE